MLNGTIRHQVGQASAQSPRKLRDSCTDCASSKVKCSKEKPTCARCARRGVTCIYMVSRRTGRTSSNASKGDATRAWIGTKGVSVNALAGSTRSSINPSATLCDSVDLSIGSHAKAHDPLSNRNNNEQSGTTRSGLRVATPLLSHPNISSTGHDAGQQTPGSGHGTDPDGGPEADLWDSILSPSALIVDSVGLSPPLTMVDNDAGNLFDLGLHSPMTLDCPEQPTTTRDNHHTVTTPDLFGDIPLSAAHSLEFDWALPGNGDGSIKPPNCCLTVALDILTRLFPNAPSSCTLPGTTTADASGVATPAKALTIDSVISKNKHIIESLTSLLDCHCSQDEYLISIMTLIALKVMGWYAAAAAEDSTPPSPQPNAPSQPLHQTPTWPGLGPGLASATSASAPASASSGPASPADRRPSSSPSSGGGPLAEQVLRAPAVVGNYCIAGRHKGRMAAQLVLSELHRVQKLVNALSRRLESIRVRAERRASFSLSGLGSGSSCGLSSAGSGDGGDVGMLGGARTPPFSVPTFCRLEEDLRNRLRVLSRETIDVLRRA